MLMFHTFQTPFTCKWRRQSESHLYHLSYCMLCDLSRLGLSLVSRYDMAVLLASASPCLLHGRCMLIPPARFVNNFAFLCSPSAS